MLCSWDSPGRQAEAVQYISGNSFVDQLQLGPNSSPLVRNSVLLIPNLLSKEERLTLVEAAEHRACEVGRREHPKVRLAVIDRPDAHPAVFSGADGAVPGGLGEECSRIWETVLNERVFPIIQTELPEAWEQLIGAECDHSCMKYLGAEPTVNRYMPGGGFEKHKDTMALTVLCLLDDQGFEGGGTEYWAEEKGAIGLMNDEDDTEVPATVRLHPAAGVGVIFHGQLWHAGAEVTAGTRYLLVGSFKRNPAKAQ